MTPKDDQRNVRASTKPNQNPKHALHDLIDALDLLLRASLILRDEAEVLLVIMTNQPIAPLGTRLRKRIQMLLLPQVCKLSLFQACDTDLFDSCRSRKNQGLH